MRKLFFRKQARIEQAFEEFLGCVERSMDLFETFMLVYLEHGMGESLERSAELIDKAESRADKIRMEIERILYRDELLPDSRGDLFRLLESCDKVINKMEAVSNAVCIRRLELPDELRGDVSEVMVPIQTAVTTLLTAVRILITEPTKVKPAADDVSRLETECDNLQYQLIRKVYRMDLELAVKIQIERFVNELGGIADRAEDAAHALEIIAVKRTL